MKAKHQWNSAITSGLSDTAILRARLREVKTVRSRPLIPGLLPLEALSSNMRRIRSRRNAANVFEALLRAGIVEEVLHGIRTLEKTDIVTHARSVARYVEAVAGEYFLNCAYKGVVSMAFNDDLRRGQMPITDEASSSVQSTSS
jgi:hypothetical protein